MVGMNDKDWVSWVRRVQNIVGEYVMSGALGLVCMIASFAMVALCRGYCFVVLSLTMGGFVALYNPIFVQCLSAYNVLEGSR
jgi:hypothetical protein